MVCKKNTHKGNNLLKKLYDLLLSIVNPAYTEDYCERHLLHVREADPRPAPLFYSQTRTLALVWTRV